jgi:hypothetical protein
MNLTRLLARILATSLVITSVVASAKLPAPGDEAKAKAAEAAAKTAHGNKLANFQLCQSMDKVAASYFANAKKAGKDTKPAATTAACENPGPFVYTPAVPASGAAPAATVAAAPAAPAAQPAPKK